MKTILLSLTLLVATVANAATLSLSSFANAPAEVGPIFGSLDGQDNLFNCITYNLLTRPPTSFDVSVRPVAAVEYAQVLLYQDMLLAGPGLLSDYQYAIWSITGVGVPVFGTSATLAAAATGQAATMTAGDFAGWWIAVPTDTKNQSFLFYSDAPEPATVLTMGAALVGLGLIRRRKA